MVNALVILDGASEPVRDGVPTSLERAKTPALDALAREGRITRIRTTPHGLAPGSEVGIPVLLGWTPTAAVARGPIEAAARDIDVPAGERAWRVDVFSGSVRADAATTQRAAAALSHAAPRHAVHVLTGHRLLVVGPPPLPAPARRKPLVAWPEGTLPPRRLNATTVVIAAAGAAAGVARSMGARVVIPDGATGGPDSDLAAKTASALESITAGARRVIVHVGGPDEAAHARDPALKVAVLERADHEVIAPLSEAVTAARGTLQVCPDHGCDPVTGEHDATPVPCLTWSAATGSFAAHEAFAAARLTERHAASQEFLAGALVS